MTVRIGDTAPDFEADTTAGRIRFHDWIGRVLGCPSPSEQVRGQAPTLSPQPSGALRIGMSPWMARGQRGEGASASPASAWRQDFALRRDDRTAVNPHSSMQRENGSGVPMAGMRLCRGNAELYDCRFLVR